MTDSEKKERESIRFEIRARNLVLKRLASPLDHAKAAADKQRAKREERVAKASEYTDYRDAQDAYGFGMITEEEFDAIVDAMEKGEEYVNNTRSAEEAAYDILHEFIIQLNGDVAALEFELLSDKEKAEVRRKNEDILNRRKNREEA